MHNNKCFICHKVGCWTNKHPRPPPASLSSFTQAAIVSEASLLLDYARKLNITEKDAVSSLGIVYGELDQDETPIKSQSSETVGFLDEDF